MRVLTIVTSVVLSCASAVALAYPKHDPNVYDQGNLWTITFHDDDSTAHSQWATQRICFLPYVSPAAGQTQIKGRWYSTSYPNWHGHYRQEGDSVKMVGNFWNGRGNDGITFDIVTSNPNTGLGVRHGTIGAGHWHEWGDNGQFGPVYGFGNTLLQRVGRCQIIKDLTEEDFSNNTLDIRTRLLENGGEAEYPQQPGQLPLEGANHLEELFK